MFTGIYLFICNRPCIIISRIYGVRGKGRETEIRGQEKGNQTFGLFENDGQQRIPKRKLRKSSYLLQSGKWTTLRLKLRGFSPINIYYT